MICVTMVICLLQSCNVLASQHIYSFLKLCYLHSPGCHVIFSHNRFFSSLHVDRSAVLTTHAALLIRSCSKRPCQTFRLKRPQTFEDWGLFQESQAYNNFRNSSLYITTVQPFFFPLDAHTSGGNTSPPPPGGEDTRRFSLNLVPSLDCSLKVFLFLVYSMVENNSQAYFTDK